MNGQSNTRTMRGRVVNRPNRYTTTSPSLSSLQPPTGSSISIIDDNGSRRRKTRIELNGVRTQLLSVENQIDENPDENHALVDQPQKKKPRTCSNAKRNKHEDNRWQMSEDEGRVLANDFDQEDEQETENIDHNDNGASKRNNHSTRSNDQSDMYQLIRKDINDVYTRLNDSLNKNMNRFENRFNKLANVYLATNRNFVEHYRSSSNDDFQSHVDFEGTNLLHIHAKNYADYARQLLRILYDEKELCSSILPSSFTHYVRKPLDKERLALFHKAVRNKYHISDEKYDEFFKYCLRRKLVDFLCDERKRQIKRQQQSCVPLEQQSLTQITTTINSN